MDDDDLYAAVTSLYKEMKARKEVADSYPSKSREEQMREASPALQDAWEKYQITLKLVEASMPKEDRVQKTPAKDYMKEMKARARYRAKAKLKMNDVW